MKKFIEVLEVGETDAVVVAGGDGTLLEVNHTSLNPLIPSNV